MTAEETTNSLTSINQELTQLQQGIITLQAKKDELKQAADHAEMALKMVTQPTPAPK